MRTSRPSLLPLFRSATQIELLARLFTPTAEPRTITELAKQISAPVSTTSREVAKLAASEIVRVETRGRSRFVSANWDLPYARQLMEMLDSVVGAEGAVADAFAAVDHVEMVVIFGSWAARRAGMPGPAPQDLDLLVVGAPSALATSRAAAVVERSIGLPVHAVTVPAASWDAGDDALVEQIKRGPVVLVKDLWSVDV